MSSMQIGNDTQRGEVSMKDKFNKLNNDLDQKVKKAQNIKLDENNLKLSK